MLSKCKSPPNLKTALWVALERSQTKPRENIACQIYEFCRHLSMWSIPGNLLVWVHVSTYVVSKQVKFFFLYEKEEAKWGDLHCQISPFFSVCCDFNSRVQFFTHKRLYPLCLDRLMMLLWHNQQWISLYLRMLSKTCKHCEYFSEMSVCWSPKTECHAGLDRVTKTNFSVVCQCRPWFPFLS